MTERPASSRSFFWSSRSPGRAGLLIAGTGLLLTGLVLLHAETLLQHWVAALLAVLSCAVLFRAWPRRDFLRFDTETSRLVTKTHTLATQELSSLRLQADHGLYSGRPRAGYVMRASTSAGTDLVLLQHDDPAVLLSAARTIVNASLAISPDRPVQCTVDLEDEKERSLTEFLAGDGLPADHSPGPFDVGGQRDSHAPSTRKTLVLCAAFMALAWTTLLLDAQAPPLPVSFLLPGCFVALLVLLAMTVSLDGAHVTLDQELVPGAKWPLRRPPRRGEGGRLRFFRHFLPMNSVCLVGSHPFSDANELEIRRTWLGWTVARFRLPISEIDALRSAKDGYGRTHLVLVGGDIHCFALGEPALARVIAAWAPGPP